MLRVIVYLGLAIAVAALEGFAFMITVGVIHAVWLPNLPTIGYGSAIVVSVLVSGLVSLMRWTPSFDE